MALLGGLGNYKNIGILIMRAGLGVMMFMHGLDKLTERTVTWTELGKAMGNLHIHFLPAAWGFMCAVTECIGGLFCVLGLWFRVVSLLMVINFIVAIVTLFARGSTVLGASEAIELGFVFAGLLFIGPGAYSVDKG